MPVANRHGCVGGRSGDHAKSFAGLLYHKIRLYVCSVGIMSYKTILLNKDLFIITVHST